MKLLIAVCAILVLFFTSSAEADCSAEAESWKVVENMPPSEILGRWYCVLRFPNGQNDTSDCLIHDVTMHPTIPNTVQLLATRTFKNGKGRRRHQTEGVLTASSNKGKARAVYKKGGDIQKYITAADFNDYVIARACFEGEEYFWAYARNQVPSDSTMTKINKDIDDQGIDRSKIIKSCTDVPAAALA